MPTTDRVAPLPRIDAAAGEGRHRVEASALLCGGDVTLVLQGGTHHHIGATVLAVPRPSLADPARVSASASVLCVTGHKEDELARGVALRLAATLACTVTVVAGLHIDGATDDDIARLLRASDDLLAGLLPRLRAALDGVASAHRTAI